MASVPQLTAPDVVLRIQKVQSHYDRLDECRGRLSLFSAWRARSPALLAFGGDSVAELVSAIVVLWRFRVASREKLAARITGALLFALAAYVALAWAMSLLGYREPTPTLVGIVVLIVAAAVIPWLAREERRLFASTGSAASEPMRPNQRCAHIFP